MEKPQKRLTARTFKNRILAASDYIIVTEPIKASQFQRVIIMKFSNRIIKNYNRKHMVKHLLKRLMKCVSSEN